MLKRYCWPQDFTIRGSCRICEKQPFQSLCGQSTWSYQAAFHSQEKYRRFRIKWGYIAFDLPWKLILNIARLSVDRLSQWSDKTVLYLNAFEAPCILEKLIQKSFNCSPTDQTFMLQIIVVMIHAIQFKDSQCYLPFQIKYCMNLFLHCQESKLKTSI